MLDLLLLGQKTAPDFLWDARGGVLPPGATFTRGSSGWSFNSAGVLTQAAANVARFDYDPSTLVPLGYLAEAQSTNSVLQSQNFATGWTPSNIVLTNNATTAPDGTTTAATMLLSAGSALHQLQSAASFPYTTGVYGVSMFVKEIAGGSWVQFTFGGNSGYNFQPSTGTSGSSLTGNQSNFVARQLANGWWRISFAFTSSVTTSSVIAVNFVNAGNATPAPTITGDGSSTIAIWGFQFETVGVGVTSYIPTTTTAVTRAADLLALPLASLPGWNASKGGVLVATYRLHTLKTSIEQNPVYVSNLSDNNIDCRAQSGTQGGLICGLLMRTTTFQIDLTGTPSPPPFVRRRTAWGWGTTEGQIAADGVMAATQSGSFTLPVGMTTVNIGGNTGNSLNGTLESLAYHAGARGDAFLQQRSAQ